LLAVMVPAGRLETTKVTTVTPGWAAAGEVVAARVMAVGVVCAHNPPLPANKTISESPGTAYTGPASRLRKNKTHLLVGVIPQLARISDLISRVVNQGYHFEKLR
jgi:hypothetical protein